MFRTEVIKSRDQFKELRSEWNNLLARSRTNTIFLTWEWLYTWWEVFGNDNLLFIVTVRDDRGELVGLAPLFIRRSRYYSLPVKEMCFIGMGLSDRQDFPIADSDPRILREIVSMIYRHEPEWNIVHLDQVTEDSQLIASYFNVHHRVEHEESSRCPYVEIQGDWDSYYKALGKKFYRDMKHKQNRLSKFGPWKFRTELVSEHGFEKLVNTLAKTEEQSRKRGVKPFFSIPGNRDFLIKFSNLCVQNGWLDFSSIAVADVPIAYLIGFLYNSKYYAYNMAFLEEYHVASPGKLLLNEKLKWCFEGSAAVKEFDFLRGDTYIKALWASAVRNHRRLVYFDKSLYTRLIRLAVFRVRPLLKKLMQKKRENEALVASGTKG